MTGRCSVNSDPGLTQSVPLLGYEGRSFGPPTNLTKKNVHTQVLIKTSVGDSNQSVHIISATGTTHEDKADANEPDTQNIGMRVCIK